MLEPEVAYSPGAQARPGSGLKPTPGPVRAAGGRRSEYTSLCEWLSPKPLFFWFAIYLLKHSQLQEAEGLPEAGSGPRCRSVVVFSLPISELASHNMAHLCTGEASSLLPAEREKTQFRFGKVLSSHLPGSQLAWTVAPRLSFLCKREQGGAD